MLLQVVSLHHDLQPGHCLHALPTRFMQLQHASNCSHGGAAGEVRDQSAECGGAGQPACTAEGVQPCACGTEKNASKICEKVSVSPPCPTRPYCGKADEIQCASGQPCDEGLEPQSDNTCMGAPLEAVLAWKVPADLGVPAALFPSLHV